MSLYSVNDEAGFPGGSVVESAWQGRRCGLDPWVGKFDPLKRKDNPLQVSCLGSPIEKGDSRATDRGWQKSLI